MEHFWCEFSGGTRATINADSVDEMHTIARHKNLIVVKSDVLPIRRSIRVRVRRSAGSQRPARVTPVARGVTPVPSNHHISYPIYQIG